MSLACYDALPAIGSLAGLATHLAALFSFCDFVRGLDSSKGLFILMKRGTRSND